MDGSLIKRILVCQNRTCRKQGAKTVLEVLQRNAPSEIEVTGSGCLGKCGSGPMVLVLPDEAWYGCVDPNFALILAEGYGDFGNQSPLP